MKHPDFNPVDYFNAHGTWEDCFKGVKLFTWVTSTEISVTPNPETPTYRICPTTHTLFPLIPDNPHGFDPGLIYSRFMVYTKIQHKGNYHHALSEIAFTRLHEEIPYIRVGTDYFKVFPKTDRYGITRKTIKPWKKDEIKQDHGPQLLRQIHRFDDFCIEPNNISYSQSVNQCYNLYAAFSHTPHPVTVSERDIPVSIGVVRHIFGEQYVLGLKYMKLLYESPTQALPILCLISEKRKTGKTTFINWLNIIFGDNFTQINPEDLTNDFNSSYATKNLITIEETLIDKITSIEKLKALSTRKMISVNQKHVAHYMIPFFSKIILATNKEKDFMRIDSEEIRFWVRKVSSIATENTSIEQQLTYEIPKFLRFLTQLPAVAIETRMVFTPQELENDALKDVKLESRSGLHKELEMLINAHFLSNASLKQFYATAKDLKDEWFKSNNQISGSYVFKVLRDEMKLQLTKMMKYAPMGGDPMVTKTGRPFLFKRELFDAQLTDSLREQGLDF
jgi:hypothetical protein